MQAYTESDTPHICEAYWLDSRDYAVKFAKEFSQRLKLHKQIVNRILEPYSHITMVVTSTEWDNFFHLRDHKAAQPEIKILAKMMHEAYDDASPQFLERGEWHLPFTNSTHRDYITQSVASCARTSYNKHDGTKATAEENSDLVAMLSSRPYTNEAKNIHFDIHEPVHLSPLEHQATPMGNQDTLLNVEGETKLDSNNQLWSGNFRQWIQLRQVIHAIVL
jgi:thymidylate synthase ThyX